MGWSGGVVFLCAHRNPNGRVKLECLELRNGRLQVHTSPLHLVTHYIAASYKYLLSSHLFLFLDSIRRLIVASSLQLTDISTEVEPQCRGATIQEQVTLIIIEAIIF